MCGFSASERQLTVLETEGLSLPGKCRRGKQRYKNVWGASPALAGQPLRGEEGGQVSTHWGPAG